MGMPVRLPRGPKTSLGAFLQTWAFLHPLIAHRQCPGDTDRVPFSKLAPSLLDAKSSGYPCVHDQRSQQNHLQLLLYAYPLALMMTCLGLWSGRSWSLITTASVRFPHQSGYVYVVSAHPIHCARNFLFEFPAVLALSLIHLPWHPTSQMEDLTQGT